MGKTRKVKKNRVRQSLEYLGKPIFLLFTLLVLLLVTLTHLFSFYTHRVFSRPISKKRQPGKPIKKHPQLINPTFWLSFGVSLSLLVIIISLSYYFIFRSLPSPLLLKNHPPALTTKILDRHGNLLYQIYRDENRTLIHLSDLPSDLIHATIASEDKDFYTHHGISFKGIFRAIIANAKGYSSCYSTHSACDISLQGGSTITQQLVKNALLSPEQTITRKLKEVLLAIWTEQLYSKDEILEMYFNYVPYGGTAYGIEEAAHQFFGKKSSELNVSESALLAGLPIAPTILSPFGTRPYLAKNRQSQVVDAMIQMGYLTDSEGLVAKNSSITFRPQGINIRAPHYVMYVKDLLVNQFGENMVNRGGLEVTTSLDLAKQTILEKEIDVELSKLSGLHVGNGAGLITDPSSGEILAMVGSRNFFDTTNDGQVNVTLQPRQPGSSIKPITYALAFMQGVSPSSLIDDSPICFTSPGQPNYCPTNYDKRFHGKVTARTALASSYNIPAIKLLNSLGINNLVSLAKTMGVKTWDDPSRFGLSLTLGGGEVTMLDMAEVYGVFANQGKHVSLQSILSVKDSSGHELYQVPKPSEDAVIPEEVAYQISSILSDPVARAPAFGTHSVLNIKDYPVAVKTGTTNNLRDNWTIGYTPNLLVATWVGNNDNSPMSRVASGVTGASPIWSRTITKLLAGTKPISFRQGSHLLSIAICPATNEPYCPGFCPTGSRLEYFVAGTEPKRNCNSSGDIAGNGMQISTTN